MTAQEYLNRLKKLNENIENYSVELEENRAKLKTVPSPNLSNSLSATGNNNARFTFIVERIELLESELNDLEKSKNIIIDQIRSLDNASYIRILLNYYDKGKEHTEIAAEINYEYGYERKLHSRALKAFQKKFPFLEKRNKKEQ